MKTVSQAMVLIRWLYVQKIVKAVFSIDSDENNGTEIKAIIPIPHFRQKIL